MDEIIRVQSIKMLRNGFVIHEKKNNKNKDRKLIKRTQKKGFAR